MENIGHKTELEKSLGLIISDLRNENFKLSNQSLGDYECTVERYKDFSSITKNFQNRDSALDIPFSRYEPCISMIFQFSGKSVYRDKYNPYILNHHHHSLNYFNRFECRSLVEEKSAQYDFTLILNENFYKDLIEDRKDNTGNYFFEKVQNKTEVNTIGQRQRMNWGIHGVLQNILHCPFQDEMKEIFLTDQIRALFLLQCCEFLMALSGESIVKNNKINTRDRDTLHDIRNYLNEYYMHPTGLTTLSRQFGINEFKLKYGFRKLFNTSPMKYVLDKRMELAALLLTDSDKGIAGISHEMGYNHPNNFSLAFRKKFGVSPQQFRSAGRCS